MPLETDSVMRGWVRSETRAGEEWQVRSVSGGDKSYRCPGCNQLIPPGTGHVVAWRSDHLWGSDAAVADRRHWHTSCWQRRR